MKLAILVLLLVGAASAAAWAVLSSGKTNLRGTLVACGGGLEFTGEHTEAAQALGELARSHPVLASLHSGAPSLKDARAVWIGEPNDPGYEEIFTKLGFKPFFVPLAVDEYAAVQKDPQWASRVASANAVFLNGGDQIRHTRALMTDEGKPSALLLAIQDVLRKGGVVIGTSAGLHAQGEMMFGGGTSEGAINANFMRKMTVADQFSASPTLEFPDDKDGTLGSYGLGLGLLPGVLLDSHSGARGRVGRMLVALAAMQRDGAPRTDFGIGVDENTCLVWDRASNTGRVRGQGNAWLLDVSKATMAAAQEPAFYAQGVRFAAFAPGDEVRLDSPGNGKIEIPRELFGKGSVPERVRLTPETDGYVLEITPP